MEPGRILVSGTEGDLVAKVRQTYYRSGVGKLLHMMRWSRPVGHSPFEMDGSDLVGINLARPIYS